MARGKHLKQEISDLLDELDNELDSNDDVRRLGYSLTALAAALTVYAFKSAKSRLGLSDVLSQIMGQTKRRTEKEKLGSLAESAEALEDLAEQLSYDDLTDDELWEANELREQLSEGLREWWEKQ